MYISLGFRFLCFSLSHSYKFDITSNQYCDGYDTLPLPHTLLFIIIPMTLANIIIINIPNAIMD